jgi:vacuolar-type H+-ATPase subunit C/Vma6
MARMLDRQIDLANVRSALDRVRRRSRGEEVDSFAPIPGGTLELRLLDEVAQAENLVDAFEVLADTYFASGIDKGILAFGRAQNLGAMERFLEIVVIDAGCRLYRGDPLSIEVPLGFLWRKYSEFLNLRILLRGKSYRMPPNTMRKEMLIA